MSSLASSRIRWVAHYLKQANRIISQCLSWSTLLMVALTFLIVVLRYVLEVGWIWMQEAVLYLHSAVFLLCAGQTLLEGGHVRVDIFYNRLSRRGRVWVDVLGTLGLLLPLCAVLIWVTWPFVADSVAVLEGSPEPGGLPAVFALKALILAYAFLLACAGIAQSLQAILELKEPAPEAAATNGAETSQTLEGPR